DESFEFIISFHHSILDGWSRVSLTTELYRYYETLLSGEALEPIYTDWTYRDFIALELQILSDDKAKEFFYEILSEAPETQIPRKISSTDKEIDQQDHRVLEFNDFSEKLVSLAKTLGMPVQVVLLTGHFKVLSLFSGNSHAVSSITMNGRPEQEGAEESLGLYLNSLPLAASLAPGNWSELLNQVNDTYRNGMKFRRYPLSVIQQSLTQNFGEVSFNYTHFHVYDEASESAEEKGVETLGGSGFEQTNYGLVMNFSRFPKSDAVGFDISFDGNLYDQNIIERLGEMYVRVYQSLLADLAASHQSRSLL
ncbi:condensation domain-containing protein, partial [Pseudoalteromonas sp. P1-9]|uniref:condensation domain-containing protein n=1 Tax=Pseudoalteromonas sp. P1-9 TaxID=1710354 RepID=UPI000AE363A6